MTPQKGDRVLAWDDDRSKAVELTYMCRSLMPGKPHAAGDETGWGYYRHVEPIKPQLIPISVLHKGKAIFVYRKEDVDAILNQRKP